MAPTPSPATLLAALLAALVLLPAASASTLYFPDDYESEFPYDVDNPQWETGINAKWVGWGKKLNVGNSRVGNYTVQVSDFQIDKEKRHVDGVRVTVTDRDTGEEVASGPHRDGGTSPYINYRDDIRVKIHTIRDANLDTDGTKWSREEIKAETKLTVETRSLPDPAVTKLEFSEERDFDKTTDDAFSASTVWVRAKFENKGNADLYDADFSLDTGEFDVLEVRDNKGNIDEENYAVEDGEVKVTWQDVEDKFDDTPTDTTDDWFDEDQSYTLRLKLRSPKSLNERKYPVDAAVQGYDIKKNTPYRDTRTEDLRVFAVAYVFKKIGPDINPDTDDFEMYINEPFTVRLEIHNDADIPITMNHIRDPVPPAFAVLANQTTEWRDIEVAPDSKTVLKYRITPQSTGTVSIPDPVTNFTWKGQGTATTEVDTEKVVIGSGTTHGPRITLEKDLWPSDPDVGETGNVTVTVKNKGDRTARVTVTDQAPGGVQLLDPIPTRTELLSPDESLTIEYGYKATDRGNFTAPAARAEYENIEGTRWTALSDTPTLRVGTGPQPSPTDTGDGDTDGTDGAPGPGETATPEPTPTESPAVPGPGATLILLAIALAAGIRHAS